TASTAEMLAAGSRPGGPRSEETRDAGAVLTRELAAAAGAIDKARESQATYGNTLAEAADRMANSGTPDDLTDLVACLADATRRIRRHTAALERRLESSNREVTKMRD